MEQRTDIVIIGSGLTGLTTAFYLRKAGFKVLVLEKNDRPGGVMQTYKKDGFTYEAGPNTGVVSSTELVELFDDLKLDFEVPEQASKVRWIWKKGRWEALPSGLVSAIGTPLFRFGDKFRILGEPFRKKGRNPDETLAQLVRRRMGKSFLNYAIDPFISGVYAGDPETLVTRYAMPKLYALEQNYGSFIRGSIVKSRQVKTALEKRVNKSVFSVEGGFSTLLAALLRGVGEESVLCTVSQLSIQPADSGFQVSFVHGTENHVVHAAKVISTIHSSGLSALFPFIPKTHIEKLENLRYARVVQVAVGYKQWSGIPLQAFGGLVPTCEKEQVLGILFPSALFKGRAPEGGALLSVFMGGIKRPELYALSNDKLRAIAAEAVQRMMQCNTAPDLLEVFRYERAIPQYEQSTGERLRAIDDIQKAFPGLMLAGNIRDGIGMSDRAKQGRQLADKLINSFKSAAQ